MAARGSTIIQYVPTEVYQGPTPPDNPAVGKLWQNTGATPDELLRWTGKGTSNTRTYAASKSGASVTIDDLSDDYALDVTVKTIASQAGSGTPSRANIRAISGRASVTATVNGTGTVLTPLTALCGVASAEDEIGSDGHDTHKTILTALTGTESVGNAGINASATGMYRARITLGTAMLPVTDGSVGKLTLSHFAALTANATYAGTEGVSGSSNGLSLYMTIPLSAIGALQGDSDIVKNAAVKAWLAGQVTAGTPVQVVYARAAQATATVAAIEIAGMDGDNTVTGDGASVVVDYTGSGWAAVGAVQRLAIEAVAVTPEQGLRVDTVLVSDDGLQQIPTFFNARGTKYGLFRLSDGKLVHGATVLADGRVVGVAGILMDPDTGDFYIDITQDENSMSRTMRLVRDGTPFLYLGDSTNSDKATIRCPKPLDVMGTVVNTSPPSSQYSPFDHPYAAGLTCLRVIESQLSFGGILLGWNDTAGAIVGYCHNDLYPDADNTYNMGSTSLRWKKYYGASATISTSDEREKHDIAPIDPALIHRFLMALDPVQFRLDALPDETRYGFIAQRFRDTMRAVGVPDDFGGFDGTDPNHLGLCYEQLIAPLVSGYQRQQAQLDALERRLKALESRAGE